MRLFAIQIHLHNPPNQMMEVERIFFFKSSQVAVVLSYMFSTKEYSYVQDKEQISFFMAKYL